MMDGMFSRLRVQGFRHLHDVDLPLRPLNVLIGANRTTDYFNIGDSTPCQLPNRSGKQ